MITFWLIAAAMIAVALAIVLPPLIDNPRSVRSPAPDELNRTLYRQRLEELEQDRDNGLLSEAQYEQACLELQRDFMADMDSLAKHDSTAERHAGSGSRIVAGIIIVGLPVLAAGLYLQFNTGWRSQAESMVSARNDNGMKQPSAEWVVAQLKDRLARHPDDGPGWRLLGQAYISLERYAEAVQAYRRANALANANDPGLLVAYAQALGMANDGRFEPESVELLEKALAMKPEQPRALWLAGWAAYQRQAYDQAFTYWQRLKNVIPSDNIKLRETLSKAINNAEQRRTTPIE